MLTSVIVSALAATSFAAPFAQHGPVQTGDNSTSTWTPAPGTETSCDCTSDKIIGFYVGPQLDTVLNDACAAMMDPCAYPERLSAQTACAQTITWPLRGPVKSAQAANVEDLNGNKLPGWDVQFAVTPAEQPENSPGVSWTKQECYGYFRYMLEEWVPEGCHTETGFHIGNITAGGDSTLKDTVFEVTIVANE